MSKFINYAKSRKVDYEEAEKVLDKAMDVVASCDKDDWAHIWNMMDGFLKSEASDENGSDYLGIEDAKLIAIDKPINKLVLHRAMLFAWCEGIVIGQSKKSMN